MKECFSVKRISSGSDVMIALAVILGTASGIVIGFEVVLLWWLP